MKITSFKFDSWRNRGRLNTHTTSSGNLYIEGVVATEWGFVRVYCDRYGYSFDFIWQGREYSLGDLSGNTSNDLVSKAKLTRRAGKFAKQIVEESDRAN